VCEHVCRELGIAIVPYSPLGRGSFASYNVEGNKGEGDIRSVCDLPFTLTTSYLSTRLLALLY
jgi:aryl-alcohol dehydrogenase-like predicted oxidoreductase